MHTNTIKEMFQGLHHVHGKCGVSQILNDKSKPFHKARYISESAPWHAIIGFIIYG